MLDAWTNIFASPGKRTTGTKAGHFAITGPGWTGTLPAGVQRAQVADQHGLDHRPHADQRPEGLRRRPRDPERYKLTPLSAFGKPYTRAAGAVDPNVDMKTPPVEQLTKMGTATSSTAWPR